MSELERALIELSNVHEKFNLQGKFEGNNSVELKWPNSIEYSEEINFFFNKFEPINIKIETGITPITFFEVEKIEQAQYGYRWIKDSASISDNPKWSKNHLVFMDDFGGGKPIIAITDIKGTPIYANYSVGEPFKIADSLADFFLSIAKLIEIVYGKFNIFDIGDNNDDDELSSEFIDIITNEIKPIIGSNNFESFFDYFYG
ncbi:hypothetical protein LGZ99_22550 [Photorhabdus temperata]|uniref:Knr4/Smi1-like domain-containing protein n=1 Tax=Photorhabdus temperata J3 TaxID=1389415 RepID=U7QTF3_PHOTE|nr:hypothetical protein [Photorhabdus temperata]ERT10542.1 hypothetical protein O185_24250 [Photorhabdus temperata J3]MCT8349902.1 hypothetical protein [Photorhabdus temperata]